MEPEHQLQEEAEGEGESEPRGPSYRVKYEKQARGMGNDNRQPSSKLFTRLIDEDYDLTVEVPQVPGKAVWEDERGSRGTGRVPPRQSKGIQRPSKSVGKSQSAVQMDREDRLYSSRKPNQFAPPEPVVGRSTE